MSLGKNRGRSKVILFIFMALVVAALGIWCYYDSNYILDVERFEVEFKTLPTQFDGFKVAHISDLHAWQFGENNSDIVRILEDESPDIVVITGDIVDSYHDIGMLRETALALASVAETYYVPGNHEYAGNRSRSIFNILRDAGIIVMRNQSVEIERDGAKIYLVGIDDPNGPADQIPMAQVIKKLRDENIVRDPYSEGAQGALEVLDAQSEGAQGAQEVLDAQGEGTQGMQSEQDPMFIMMLNHRYERFAEYAELKIPIVFTGHAHGGLIRVPFTDGLVGPGRVILPKYTNGRYVLDETTMITSRGIGNAGWTRRLFNRPHIPIVVLRSSS